MSLHLQGDMLSEEYSLTRTVAYLSWVSRDTLVQLFTRISHKGPTEMGLGQLAITSSTCCIYRGAI